jgi:hypothetical protein
VHQPNAGDGDRRMTERLDAQWSYSIGLFKYFYERRFVSVGNEPSAFSSRTAQ